MTIDEATAALAANPAALVLAGRDVDAIIGALGSRFDAQLDDAVRAFRKSLAGASSAEQLVLVAAGTAKFGALLAAREKERTDAAAFVEARRLAGVRASADHARANAARERTYRATHPLFCAVSSRVDALRSQLGEATTPADFAAARDAFASFWTETSTAVSDAIAGLATPA